MFLIIFELFFINIIFKISKKKINLIINTKNEIIHLVSYFFIILFMTKLTES
jgi:hypothetical protein